VLHLLPDLEIGGGQTIVLNHLQHADDERFDPLVAVLDGGGPLTADVAAATGAMPVDLAYRPGHELQLVRRLVALLRSERIDLLHVHSDVDRKLGQVAALVTGIPVVGHLHAEWIHLGAMTPASGSWLRRRRARIAGAARDAVERRTVVRYVAESARVRARFGPLVRQPISVLRQAIPIDRFDGVGGHRREVRAGLGLDEWTPVVICVSRLAEGKGQTAVLDAFSLLREHLPGAVLLLVGDGPEREALEARARRLGVESAARFLGSRRDVPELLGASDVFAFASDNEGFGLAVLEAMAASVPVVAYRLPALEEFVVAGETGALVEHGDVAELARGLEDVLRDGERALAMGVAGRRVVEERFDPASVARSFEEVYDAALATGGAPRRREA
jgi:glycosyltransferase involved in cell wall biosynthesis